MPTGAPEGGEGQQMGEVLFRKGDQILYQHPLRGGEQSALQERPPVLQKVVPAKPDHLRPLDLNATEPEQPSLVRGRLSDDLALDHDDKLVAETQHSVQALLADPLGSVWRAMIFGLLA